jgi:hypothetical protein
MIAPPVAPPLKASSNPSIATGSTGAGESLGQTGYSVPVIYAASSAVSAVASMAAFLASLARRIVSAIASMQDLDGLAVVGFGAMCDHPVGMTAGWHLHWRVHSRNTWQLALHDPWGLADRLRHSPNKSARRTKAAVLVDLQDAMRSRSSCVLSLIQLLGYWIPSQVNAMSSLTVLPSGSL